MPLRLDTEVWRLLARLGARYGPEPWLRLSPPLIGAAVALALPDARRAVRGNLRRVLGERSPTAETLDVLRTFAAYASCLAEGLASDRTRGENAVLRVADGERLSGALAEGRGVVLLTAHTGAWDAAAPRLGRDLGVPVTIVMQRERSLGARDLHDSVRRAAGVRIVHIGAHPLEALPLLEALRSGGVVAVQIDRVPTGARRVPVSLFGAPAVLPQGPFSLAAAAGAPLLPLFVRRAGFFDYEIEVCAPLRLARRPSPAELSAAAGQAAAEMERFVRRNPTQWFHFE